LSGFEFGCYINKFIKKKISIIYVLNADYLEYNTNDFIIYQGYFSNSEFIFNKANIILPSAIFLEKETTYINLEGRYRFSKRAIIPFKLVNLDSDIIQTLNSLRIKNIFKNFSIFDQFFEILLNFNNIINYECFFFSSIKRFIFKLQKKL
jgi:NADH dehydrogenase/NADH:ubiquinone oxidoreductase subunit G